MINRNSRQWFYLLIMTILFSSNISLAGVNAQDSLALIALYDSTNGVNWTVKWDLNQHVSGWYGIKVDSNRVTEIDLYNNNLNGSLPPDLGSLSKLKIFDLNHNVLHGSIPSTLGKLTRLIQLNLNNNILDGQIPKQLGSLSRLTHLELASNNLNGSIPKELGQLSQLQYLKLYYNQLTNVIPTELTNLSSLKDINFAGNDLTGAIPLQFGNLPQLQKLNLGGNQLIGSIPLELGNLTNLTSLVLYGNKLNNSVPAELGNCGKLNTLNLSGNEFVELPDFSVMPIAASIQNFWIEENKFTFEDIEPYMALSITNFTYTPQDSVGEKQKITLLTGNSLTLNVTVNGSANEYQWMKNDVDIDGATTSDYVINSATNADEGSYVCKITNTIVPELTLFSRVCKIDVTSGTAMENESRQIPLEFGLKQNYPNPFNPTTIINYQLAVSAEVQLNVYNVVGELVKTLISGQQPAGQYSVIFNAHNLANGVYFYELRTNDFVRVRKMTLLK